MREAKELAQEYSRAMDITRRVEEELAGVLIKYIVGNSFEPKKCTETAMAESLEIPKSMIRRVLTRLSEEFIVRTEDWGTVKPYQVWTFGAALDKGYVTLGRKEMSEMLAVGEMGESPMGPSKGAPSVWTQKDGKRVVRFLGPDQRRVYRTLMDRFFWYVPRTGFEKVFKEAFPKDFLAKLESLAPEQSLLEDVSRLPETSDTLWYVSNYTIDVGFWEKQSAEADPTEMKNLAQHTVWTKIMFALQRLKVLESLMREKGSYAKAEGELSSREGCPVDRVEGEDGKLQGEERFRKEYLFATTLALREGCKFARALGVEEPALKEAEELCEFLDQAAENPDRNIKPKA